MSNDATFRDENPPTLIRHLLMKYARALLAASVLAACAPAFHPLPHSVFVRRSYESGGIQTAAIGDPIFRVWKVSSSEAFVLDSAYTHALLHRQLKTGTVFQSSYRDRSGNLLIVARSVPGLPSFVIAPDSGGGERRGRVGYLPLNGSNRVAWISGIPPRLRAAPDAEHAAGGVSAEMVYSGLAGTVVNAVYREYVDDLARPAFFQAVQYDLAADSVLAFRTIRIRVRSATNSALSYEVLEDGGLPWLP